MMPVNSSMLKGVNYEESSRLLTVQYKGTNDIYNHPNVPPHKFIEMMHAPSIGNHFNHNIRMQHPGKKQPK